MNPHTLALLGPSTWTAHLRAAAGRCLVALWRALAALRVIRPHAVPDGRLREALRPVTAGQVVAAARAARHREPAWCDPGECDCWWESDGTVVVFHRALLLDEPTPRGGRLRVDLIQCVTTRPFGPVERNGARLYVDGVGDGLTGAQLARFARAVAQAAHAVDPAGFDPPKPVRVTGRSRRTGMRPAPAHPAGGRCSSTSAPGHAGAVG